MSNSPEANASLQMKVKNDLIHFIYPNLLTTVPLLIAVACMLTYKLNGHVDPRYLGLWLGALLVATIFQGVLGTWFKKTEYQHKWDNLYFKLLLVNVAVIGVLWGIAGVFLMPDDTLAQSYLIFTLVFVAAGGPLYLAGSFLAGSLYTSGVIVPLVASIIFSFFSQVHHEIYSNIVLGLGCYWGFLLTVNYYGSKLFNENFAYSLKHQELSEVLSQSNENLEVATIEENTEMHKTLSFELGNINALPVTNTHEILETQFIQSRAYARRHHQSLAVFLININNLNSTETSLDKEAANLLLKTAAIRLLYCKRETDILSRISENKFVLVVSEIVLGNETQTVANKILNIFAERNLINEVDVPINASIGISLFPQSGEELPDLIKHAEIALSTLQSGVDQPKFQIYDSEKMKHVKQNVATTIAGK
jgi:diguanylate cyclase (GGDEF)-like protein